MTASDLAALAFASCFVCACAVGYDADVSSMTEAATMLPTAGLGGMGGAGGGAGDSSSGGSSGMGGAPAPLGDPCTRNDIAPCPCEGSDAQGERRCRFDMASPTQGFFSECMGCPAPMPAATCSDAMHNGAETSADCGGPECPPCALGSACVADSDCAAAMCLASVCTTPPETGGAGGSSGASGEGGESGSEAGAGGEPPIEEPVEDCDGVPEGTECDRDCILPTNTARCNSRGDCSCL